MADVGLPSIASLSPLKKVPLTPMDCTICSMPIVDPAIGGGCCHHFCLECYEEWSGRKATCPTCRAPVWNIKVDLEYASLCGAHVTPKAMARVDEAQTTSLAVAGLRVTVQIAWPAGLTLTNSPKGDAVLVVRVVRGNGAYQSGIRVGDLILTVNGTAVREHSTAVDFIEQRCRIGDCLVEVRKSDSLRQPTRRLLRRLSSGIVRPSRAENRRSGRGGSSASSSEDNGSDAEEDWNDNAISTGA